MGKNKTTDMLMKKADLKTGYRARLKNGMMFIVVMHGNVLLLVDEDGYYHEKYNDDMECTDDSDWDIAVVYDIPVDDFLNPSSVGDVLFDRFYANFDEIIEGMFELVAGHGHYSGLHKYPVFKDGKMYLPEGYYSCDDINSAKKTIEEKESDERVFDDIKVLNKAMKSFADNGWVLCDDPGSYEDDFAMALRFDWITMSDYVRLVNIDEVPRRVLINKMAKEYGVKIEN